MATQQNQLTSQETTAERRRWGRAAPELLTYVSFGGDGGEPADNGGMVLDVGENGLAIVAALAMSDGARLNIAIPADASHPAMEVRGRVVWMAGSRRRVGVQLEELSGSKRELWHRWILAISGPDAEAPENAAIATRAPGSPVILLATEAAASAAMPERGVETAPLGPSFTEGLAKDATKLSPAAAERAQVESMQPRVRSGPQTGATQPATHGGPALVRTPSVGGGERTDVPIPAHFAKLPSRAKLPAVAQAGVARSAVLVPGTRKRRAGVAAAFAMVVAASFGLGIVIGRDILVRRDPPSAAVASANIRPAATSSGAVAEGAQPVGVATREPASADRDAPSVADAASANTPVAAQTRGNGSLLRADALEEPATGAISSKAGRIDSDVVSRGAEGGDGAMARTEILVTPNAGDAPLRMDFPEEIIAQSASLEIRARRFVLVPGAPPRRGKTKKERLLLGSMISRVTPQEPASAMRAAGALGGEPVVSVRATIAGDGHVAYVDSLGGPIALIPVVMSAVRAWRYEASTLDGEPVETGADLTITFRRAY